MMAVHAIGLITVIFSVVRLKGSLGCELVPSNDGSCFELRATPYITFATSQFGPEIEGASVNPAGEMFATNFGTSELYQLGQIYPQQKLFYRDVNATSSFNGIRFFNAETAFVADKRHRVLKLTIDAGNVVTNSENYCSNATMVEPNDVAISKSGTVYTSGQHWVDDTDDKDGDIWSCLPNGKMQLLDVLGRTNGIELSPDEKYLYVSESYNRGGDPYFQKIWRYNANVAEGTISDRTLFVDFDVLDDTSLFDVDGMRTDIHGNLFVSRYGGRHIAVFSAQGQLIGKIAVSFPNTTNVDFGGPNGTTLFIVGQCDELGKGCVDRIEVNTPGRAWSELQASNAWSVFHKNNFPLIFLLLAAHLRLVF